VEKIWLKSYDPGIPETINPDEYASLIAILEECFQKFADKVCYTNMGRSLTYREVDALSKQYAAFLQNNCRLSPGDRVAIMLPNVLQFPVALFGILRAGMIAVNINPLYTPRELKNVLKDSGARCILVLENFAHVLEKVLPESRVQYIVVTGIGDLLGTVKGTLVNLIVKYVKKMIPQWDIADAYSFRNILATQSENEFERVEAKGEDIALLQYTGGTTGDIKGAMLTHRNMVANILQAYAWIAELRKQNLEGGIITALPLYHIFSLTANCLVFLRIGIPNILVTNPRDIPGFVKILKKNQFSVITGVNTLFNALLNNEEFCKLDFSKFKFTLGGGMAVQKAVAARWKEVTGVVLLEAYGLTETSPAVTINPLSLKEYNGSIGLPIPSTEIKVCDDDGNELGIGEAGELYVRGPQVMKGYWNQPKLTELNLTAEGWVHTGDVATVDEQGYVRIVDRKKDIIIVSGFNVYPNEVEDVIASMPQVREVAVIGVPSEEHGELVKAYIVRKDPTLTEKEVLDFCHQELTGYKIPKIIEFREDLPKTNVGKVSRLTLREELKDKEKK